MERPLVNTALAAQQQQQHLFSLRPSLPLPAMLSAARVAGSRAAPCRAADAADCTLHAARCIPSSYAGYAVSIGAPVTTAWQRLLPAGHTLALPNSLAASSARREPRHWAAQRSSRMPTAIAGRTRAAQALCVQVSKRSRDSTSSHVKATPRPLPGHFQANPMPPPMRLTPVGPKSRQLSLTACSSLGPG
jgi:hypothetical protein